MTQKPVGMSPICGCTSKAATRTRAQPTQTEKCQVTLNIDQRASEGRCERPAIRAPS